MNNIVKMVILTLVFTSNIFASKCDAPGMPSKKLYFGGMVTQKIYPNQREYWFCIDNIYDGFTIYVDRRNTMNQFFYPEVFDKNLNNISSEQGSAGSFYSATAYGGEPKYDRNLKKGRYFLKFDIRSRRKNSSFDIYLKRSDRGIVGKLPFKPR